MYAHFQRGITLKPSQNLASDPEIIESLFCCWAHMESCEANALMRASESMFHFLLMSLYSKVVCVLLNSWDGNKEWSADLPEGEEALAIAAGKGWVAVATDTRNLRLFTVAGTQREVISLPGPVVCIVGHRNRLLVICHNGMGKSRDVGNLMFLESN
jgi:hypothetical protein